MSAHMFLRHLAHACSKYSLIAGLAFTLGAAALGSSAEAQTPAAGPAMSAVLNRYNAIPGDERSVYFARPSSWTPVPMWTADGAGAFMFFDGTAGPSTGAIYYNPQVRRAYLIYGAILTYFVRTGFEHHRGYPLSDEGNDSGGVCDTWSPSPGVIRVQRSQAFGNTLYCWAPGSTWEANIPR